MTPNMYRHGLTWT